MSATVAGAVVAAEDETAELVALAGEPAVKEVTPRVRELLPAFALSEAEAGPDAAAMRPTAVRDGDDWVIDGAKA